MSEPPISAAPQERDPRLCSHPGKDGTGCKAYSRHDGTGLCAGHGADPEELKRLAQRSAEVRHSRAEERPKSLKDAISRRVEARADEIAALIDHDIERKDSGSVRSWIEQVYGKPQQTVVTEDGSKAAEEMSLTELEEAKRRLLERDSNVTQLRNTA